MMWCRRPATLAPRRVPHQPDRWCTSTQPLIRLAGQFAFGAMTPTASPRRPLPSAAMNDEHSIVVVYSIDRTAPDTEVPIATTKVAGLAGRTLFHGRIKN